MAPQKSFIGVFAHVLRANERGGRLVVQNYFGGEIRKCNNLARYFNKTEGKFVDLTSKQFNFEVDYSNSVVKQPDMSKADMQKRYLLLKTKVEEYVSKSVEAAGASACDGC